MGEIKRTKTLPTCVLLKRFQHFFFSFATGQKDKPKCLTKTRQKANKNYKVKDEEEPNKLRVLTWRLKCWKETSITKTTHTKWPLRQPRNYMLQYIISQSTQQKPLLHTLDTHQTQMVQNYHNSTWFCKSFESSLISLDFASKQWKCFVIPLGRYFIRVSSSCFLWTLAAFSVVHLTIFRRM